MSTENEKLLHLSEDEKRLLKRILDQEKDKLLDLLHALHRERTLEFQIYSSREQWFWVPWTTCLAGALLGITRGESLSISVGVPLVTGFIAFILAWRRVPGLAASYAALNMRHRWVVAITESVEEDEFPGLKTLGFKHRLKPTGDRGSDQAYWLDDIHDKGFAYPRRLPIWTSIFWLLLVLLGYLSHKLP